MTMEYPIKFKKEHCKQKKISGILEEFGINTLLHKVKTSVADGDAKSFTTTKKVCQTSEYLAKLTVSENRSPIQEELKRSVETLIR